MTDETPATPKAAMALGLRWYFTGKPCAKGHIAKRSASTRECRACVDARHRANRAADPAPYRAREKQRRMKDPSGYRERMRASYARHREKRAAQDKARYPAEAERRKAQALGWIRAHPAYAAARCALQRARRRRATPLWLSADQRRQMVQIYREARSRPGTWEVDHIVPLAGRNVCGLHVPWNLRIIPRRENRAKGNRHDAEAGLFVGGDGAQGDGGG